MAHLYRLCEDGTDEAGHLCVASLGDFLRMLREAGQELGAELAILEQEVVRAQALLAAYNGGNHNATLTYGQLCKVMKLLDPYLDKYPDLSAVRALRLFEDNQLDEYYPLSDEW